MKINTFLVFLFLMGVLLFSGKPQATPAAAQNGGLTFTMLEDFCNGQPWGPRFNTAQFNHTFADTGWGLGATAPGEPQSPSPCSVLGLYADNEDRVTFNLSVPAAFVSRAQVWAWASPAADGYRASRGRVVFEGTGDTKTFTFTGGAPQWKLYEANDTDMGDNGRVLGAIVAVRLISRGTSFRDHDEVLFDDLQVVASVPPRLSNLNLTMSGPASPLAPGSTVNYDLTITNTGPEDAPNITLEDTLPYGGVFVPGGSTSGCTLSSGLVRCNLGTLAVGATRAVTIAVQVGSDACATFVNRATVTAGAYDNNMADNTAVHTATTANPACADLAVTLTGLSLPLDPGDILTYELTIINNGPDTTAATATVTLPSGITLQQTYPDSGVSCSAGAPLTCTAGTLVAGQQKQVLVEGKTDLTLTGLQTTPAQVTSPIADPIPANNNTRFRFALGRPFDFTIIAQLNAGAWAGLRYIEAVDINEQGEVAFLAVDDYNEPTDYGVFVGDGQTLTRRFAPANDLPPLTDGIIYRPRDCIDLSDAGVIAMSHDILDPALPVGVAQVVGSVLTRLNADGSVTPLDTQTEAADGTAFRRYGQAVLDNGGSVVARYDSIYYTHEPEGLVRVVNGQPVTIYQAGSPDISIYNLGSATGGGFAWSERDPGDFFSTYRLLWAQGTPSGWFLQDVLTDNYRAPVPNTMIGVAPYGGIIYKQDTLHEDGFVYEALYIGRQQVLLNPLVNSHGQYRHPVINDRYRYAFYSNGDGPHGIYFGPNLVTHRVVRDNTGSGLGDPMFGSRVVSASVSFFCHLSINNAGQIAFAVGLADGRTLIVRAEPTLDNDGDGITDWDELNAPNNGDGNGDGIPDSVQPEVTSVSNAVDGRAITFAIDPNYTLTNVQAISNPSPGNAPNDPFYYGFFSFDLTDVPPGGSATVEVTLPGAGLSGWWKYGRTPDNPTPHWYDFTFDGATGAEINGNIITLHFVDGRRGDDDLTANGIIIDPGAPSVLPYSLYLPAVIR